MIFSSTLDSVDNMLIDLKWVSSVGQSIFGKGLTLASFYVRGKYDLRRPSFTICIINGTIWGQHSMIKVILSSSGPYAVDLIFLIIFNTVDALTYSKEEAVLRGPLTLFA